MRKLIKQHEEKEQKGTVDEPMEGAVPAYLLDRQQQTAGTVLSNAIKQKRKEKAVYFEI
jgi:ribosome biogenesis protein NSA2